MGIVGRGKKITAARHGAREGATVVATTQLQSALDEAAERAGYQPWDESDPDGISRKPQRVTVDLEHGSYLVDGPLQWLNSDYSGVWLRNGTLIAAPDGDWIGSGSTQKAVCEMGFAARAGLETIDIMGSKVAAGVHKKAGGGHCGFMNVDVEYYRGWGVRVTSGNACKLEDVTTLEWGSDDAEFLLESNFTGKGIWIETADFHLHRCTPRWTQWPMYITGYTGLITGCHPFNGGNGVRVRSNQGLIYLGPDARGNVFDGCYLDNGIVEVNNTANVFVDTHYTLNGESELSAFFRLVAQRPNDALDRFIFGVQDIPVECTIGDVPLFELAATAPNSWAIRPDSLLLRGDDLPDIAAKCRRAIRGTLGADVWGFVGQGSLARIHVESAGSTVTGRPKYGAEGDVAIIDAGDGATIRVGGVDALRVRDGSIEMLLPVNFADGATGL